jgi:hypothetical protein
MTRWKPISLLGGTEMLLQKGGGGAKKKNPVPAV